MATPIILWNPTAVTQSDDAGNSIVKTTLAPPVRPIPQYKAYDPEQPRKLNRVPKLASFCIRALSKYPEQLHQLGSTRLYFNRKKGGTDGILRAVLPKWKTADFSLLNVDPRLWATVIQIYRNPPSLLSSYPLQLSDPHVPLLNQIPATPDFALLTVLDLNGSSHLTDDNILSLKLLHNLTALDVSRCRHITPRGIGALSRTLTFNDLGEKRGPWALRVLKMCRCYKVNGVVFDHLHNFPLLSVVDLRNTSCKVEDIKRPFYSTGYGDIFELPLGDAIQHISETHEGVFSNETPFILSLQDKPLPSASKQPRSRSTATPLLSKHNSFVVLPPSRGASFSGRPMTGPIQFGNIDAIEFKEKKAEREDYLEQIYRRDEYYQRLEPEQYHEDEWSCDEESGVYDDSDSCHCEECCYESDGESSSEDGLEYDGDLTTDLYARSGDSDAQLLSALQESRVRQTGEAHTAAPVEAFSDALLLSVLQESEVRRTEEAQTTAPVEGFYQQRPYTSPQRLPRKFEQQSYDLALLRVPPTWCKLDAITPESQLAGREGASSDKRRRLEEASLMVKKKRKATMQALQSELSKRRKSSAMVKEPDSGEVSPPPSQTSTLCDAGEISNTQRPALRPISNLRPPPRPLLAGPPRMKLDPAFKPVATSSSSSKPLARFSAVVTQGTLKPRNTSLAEGFKMQARKPPVSPFTGVAIKAPGSKGSSNEFKFLKKPTSKRGSGSKPCSKGKNTKPTSAVRAGGFDWNGWKKG